MLRQILASTIRAGGLTLIEANGRTTTFGQAENAADPDIVIRLKGTLTPLKLVLWPDLYLGEAYMDGALIIERGTIWDLLDLCGRNLPTSAGEHSAAARLVRGIARWLQQHNPAHRARRNVAHHYNLSPELYRAFLDEDLQYSCAYFAHPRLSLNEAQHAKKVHIASKLRLRPGCRILDIGCGWGGLALFLGELEDVEVLGVTLSEEQLQVAKARAIERGLQRRVRFELLDYRAIQGTFDRIVSVGMFEHVGTPHYPEFFRKISALLAEHGVALVHSIGRMHGPNVTSAWIRKYIFPGGYAPAFSQVMPAIEDAGLWLTDLEILREHYAETLRSWRQAFLSRLSEISVLYDDRFCRMWEYYLAVSEMAFRYGGFMVFQAQLARHIDAVPFTRDYMADYERGLDRIAAEIVPELTAPSGRSDLALHGAEHLQSSS